MKVAGSSPAEQSGEQSGLSNLTGSVRVSNAGVCRASAWDAKAVGSNPTGLSELVEFQAFGMDLQGW